MYIHTFSATNNLLKVDSNFFIKVTQKMFRITLKNYLTNHFCHKNDKYFVDLEKLINIKF